jgi:hypothetical protein
MGAAAPQCFVHVAMAPGALAASFFASAATCAAGAQPGPDVRRCTEMLRRNNKVFSRLCSDIIRNND